MSKIVGGEDDVLDDGALFFMKPEPTIFLRDRYMEPPFTVLDRRGGAWQARDRQWKALGIQSEVGRDVRLLTTGGLQGDGATFTSETSIFSPTLAELMYRWYSKPGAVVLDPFAGGSVRGIVASHLERQYVGVELSAVQVAANEAQAHLARPDLPPMWIQGDSREVLAEWAKAGPGADMIMSCPPYAYLEKYSDDPADISNMSYPDFLAAYRDIIRHAATLLQEDRFAVWVIGEVRDKRGDGSCLGVIADTVTAFRDAGMRLYNDHVMLTPIGTAPQRAPKQFDAARKAGRVHEYALVFIKGDAKRASEWLGAVQDKAEES